MSGFFFLEISWDRLIANCCYLWDLLEADSPVSCTSSAFFCFMTDRLIMMEQMNIIARIAKHKDTLPDGTNVEEGQTVLCSWLRAQELEPEFPHAPTLFDRVGVHGFVGSVYGDGCLIY